MIQPVKSYAKHSAEHRCLGGKDVEGWGWEMPLMQAPEGGPEPSQEVGVTCKEALPRYQCFSICNMHKAHQGHKQILIQLSGSGLVCF